MKIWINKQTKKSASIRKTVEGFYIEGLIGGFFNTEHDAIKALKSLGYTNA